MNFSWADDWWWLVSLLAFHAAVFFGVVSSRHEPAALVSLGSFCLLFVMLSDAVNFVIIESQEMFASKPYFDITGRFTNMLITAPLLTHALIICAFLLVYAVHAVQRYFFQTKNS